MRKVIQGWLATWLFLIIGSSCQSAVQPLPTLIPTLSPAHTAVPSLIATLIPTIKVLPTSTATDLPPTPTATLEALPSITYPPASPSPIPTLQPPEIVTANGTITIKLSAAQVTALMNSAFSRAPIPGFASAPTASFVNGTLQLDYSLSGATPQPITLTLTLAVQPTVTGSILDIRAVKLTKPDSVTTLQVKPAQALLTTALSDLAQKAANVRPGTALAYNAVSLDADTLTLTFFVP